MKKIFGITSLYNLFKSKKEAKAKAEAKKRAKELTKAFVQAGIYYRMQSLYLEKLKASSASDEKIRSQEDYVASAKALFEDVSARLEAAEEAAL